MEIMNSYVEDFQEIKICRLCGSNNKENIDIFASKPISSRSEDLLTKIITVYPLVLYKDDPLPQHICPKCIGNVSTTYQDIQQVLKQQSKWMSLTKAVQPEHKYFRILNAVENSTKATKESIKSSYNIDINNIPLKKLLATSEIKNHNTSTTNNSNNVNINENVVKNIQTKLESNGFTIKRIKVSTSTDNNHDSNILTDSISLSDEISDTNDDDDDIVTCKYCKQTFSNLKILAQHQLIHLRLNSNKVFERQLLPKPLRRGRLITINDNKCIRCLNCWRIFADNKAILQHWSGRDCEFYCCICGKDFPQSPKMLREHVTDAHGINYRCMSREFMSRHAAHAKPIEISATTLKSANIYPMSSKLKDGLVKKVYKKPPPKSCNKNDDGTITCKICYKVFDNFRSSNSHMRMHKPRIRMSIPSAHVVDNYNTQDDYMTLPSTSHIRFDNSNPSATSTNFLHTKPPRPAYRVIMKNGPLRGIKTKIVQKRQDFLINYPNSVSHSNGKSMASTSSETNDDNENMIVPELLMPAIKSESMPQYSNSPLVPGIKSEPMDNSEYAKTEEALICFICNEPFSSNRDYELHTMFVHNIN